MRPGVAHLFLHGSYARVTEIRRGNRNRARKLSLIGRAHLEKCLTGILGVTADLSEKRVLTRGSLTEWDVTDAPKASPLSTQGRRIQPRSQYAPILAVSRLRVHASGIR